MNFLEILRSKLLYRTAPQNESGQLVATVYGYETAEYGALLCDNYGRILTAEQAADLEQELEEALRLARLHRALILAYTNPGEIEAYNEERFDLEVKCKTGPQKSARSVAPPKQGFVYLMLNARNAYYKIGFSISPTFREKTLQAEEPDVRLIDSFPGTMADEARLHAKYAEKRKRGEWFELSEEEAVNWKA